MTCRSRRQPLPARPPPARACPARAWLAGTDAQPSLLLRGLEHVARLPNGLDQRRAGRVELAAQIADVGLDDIGVAAEVVAPQFLEDLRRLEHPPQVEHDEHEQAGRGGWYGDLRI